MKLAEKDTDAVSSASKDTAKRLFCTFWVSGRLFGVDILDVKEINRELEFTPIFHAPEGVKGYVNIRGQIHLVIDLRMSLGFRPKETDNDSCILIFKQTVAEPFGVLVDKIGDVIEVEEDKIERHLKCKDGGSYDFDHLSDNANLIDGVCKLENNLLVILNARNFLNTLAIGGKMGIANLV